MHIKKTFQYLSVYKMTEWAWLINLFYVLCYVIAALDARVTVVDRPMTQQGLGGMKTAAKGKLR